MLMLLDLLCISYDEMENTPHGFDNAKLGDTGSILLPISNELKPHNSLDPYFFIRILYSLVTCGKNVFFYNRNVTHCL